MIFLSSTKIFCNPYWIIFTHDSIVELSDEIVDISVDNNGSVWVAGNLGLTQFKDSLWSYIKPSFIGLKNDHVVKISFDKKGNFWMQGIGGIYLYDGISDLKLFNNSNSVLKEERRILMFNNDNKNNKWFATGYGLAFYNDTNWTLYTTKNSGLIYDECYNIAIDSSGNKWVSTRFGICKFTDTSWIKYDTSNSPLPSSLIYCKVDKNNKKWFGAGDKLYTYNDTTWYVYDKSSTGISDFAAYNIKHDKNSIVWINAGTFLIKYDGINWKKFIPNVKTKYQDITFTNFVIDSSGNLWCNNMWRNYAIIFHEGGVLDISGIEDYTKIDEGAVSVFPNPFSTTTNISFTLAEPCHVRLTIYDTYDSEVATIVSEQRNTGTYTETFDAISLAAGLYFYRLQTGAAVMTGKTTFIK
ncbi:MAG: two component regulator propeller domain protein [Ignavibacteria bacterium]|nr:two component regulator propeller domain protein [Ignavibacteria bacterium]